MTFMPGDTMRSYLIPIIDDAIVENPERLIISLSSTDPSAVLGPDSTVLIFDGEILTYITVSHQKDFSVPLG